MNNNWPVQFGLPSQISLGYPERSLIRVGEVVDQESSRLWHPQEGVVQFHFSQYWFSIFQGFFHYEMAIGSRPTIINMDLDGTLKAYHMYMHKGFTVVPDSSYIRWTVGAKIYLEEL